jgi:hypothetical protein
MIDRDAHVGQLLLALDFTGTGTSPALEAVMPPETDPAAVAATISAEIRQVLVRRLGQYSQALPDDIIGIQVNPRTGIINTRAERHAAMDATWKKAQEAFCDTEEEQVAQERAIDVHPDNGKLGWWRVGGIRHSCLVKASSCREALTKAADKVGSWESPAADWVGEELPDVIGL